MKKKALIGGVLAVLILGGVFLFLQRGSEPVRIITVDRVQVGSVRNVLQATGIVKAQVGSLIKIGARATGILEKVFVKVGDSVKKGDLVAVVDDRELQAKLAEAEARLQLALARQAYAAKTLPRKQQLFKKRLDSQDSLDQAVQNSRVAEFEVAAARASLETLRVQSSYYKVYSPMDGVVSQVAAQEGETIVSGLNVSNLVTVLDPMRLEMWIYVDETDIGRVHVGLPVEFTVDAHMDKAFQGRIDRVYPEPEIRDNIVYYRALVSINEEQAQSLRPEMTTQCMVVVETREKVLCIPNAALKWVAGRQVVFVGEEGEKSPKEVLPQLGLQGFERSEVLSGLAEGDSIAVQLVIPGRKLGEKGL